MFEIRCIVDDKKLPALLRVLENFVAEPPIVRPALTDMLNGDLEKHLKKTGAKEGGVKALDIITQYVVENKLKTVTASEMRKRLVERGYSVSGYSYVLQLMLKSGLLEKTDVFSHYKVNKQ